MQKILVIVGPTASGKTQLGIELAKRFHGEVICVDSRTVYRGMDIGTAKPGVGGLGLEVGMRMAEAIPHWGIDLVEPDEEYSIAEFKAYAEKKIEEIAARGKLPILVGGTALWVDAIVDNLDLPSVPPNPSLRAELEALSLEDLQKKLLDLDPDGGSVVDMKNKRRVIRALEVLEATGKSAQVMRQKGEPKYEVLKIGLNVPREELEHRINARVDAMIDAGLAEEVERLRVRYGAYAPAMSGIGYRDTNPEQIKKETRQLARRQLTWFKRDSRIQWIKNLDEALTLISSAKFL